MNLSRYCRSKRSLGRRKGRNELIRIEALNEARVIDVAQRLRANPPWDERIEADVTAILRGVKSKGDEDIIDYTRKLN
jgi:histidinol dehydrogenase